jgi:hypothetical protein
LHSRVKKPKTADLRFLGFFFLSPILLQADLNSGSKKERDSEVVWDGGDGDEVQGQEQR